MSKWIGLILCTICFGINVFGCSKKSNNKVQRMEHDDEGDSEKGSAADGDTDSDTDTDADSDSDTDFEEEPDNESDSDTGPIYIYEEDPDGGAPIKKLCSAADNFDAFELDECELQAPAGSFDPQVEWRWSAPQKEEGWFLDAYGPPLVANMTDDNGDGRIDLCDTPDIIVVAGGPEYDPMERLAEAFPNYVPPVPIPVIHVIDGATGKTHYSIDELRADGLPKYPVNTFTVPAIGDIDDDGRPEIVAVQAAASMMFDLTALQLIAISLLAPDAKSMPGLMVFEDDGTLKYKTKVTQSVFMNTSGSLGVNLADLDGDGTVEIVAGVGVFDSKDGSPKWAKAEELAMQMGGQNMATIIADLDMDGFQDLVTGTYGFDRDGNKIYDRSDLVSPEMTGIIDFLSSLQNLVGLYPLVANFDKDPEPEVLVSGRKGIFMLDPPDYKTKFVFKPSEAQFGQIGEFGPATVHDFNGDGKPEIGLGTSIGFALLDNELAVQWVADTSVPASNRPGLFTTPQEMSENILITGATAFDFLGDGVAEAIYSDRYSMLILDGKTGDVVMGWPHVAGLDFPVVADVDDDQSAEIVFANIVKETAEEPAPSLVVIGDKQDRWIPTRRIWNMGSYHVTNVLEDSRIPKQEPPNWATLNTFRTNVQMEAGGVCQPVVVK